MKPVDYITQITKQDLEELAALTNIEPGFCISIDKSQGKVKIGIDQVALAQAINGFIRNGGANTNGTDCTNVSFEPPS